MKRSLAFLGLACIGAFLPLPALLFFLMYPQIDPREILEPKIASKGCRHRQYEGDEHCWCKYPQSLYPNWTPVQQGASRITEALKNKHGWRVYPLVVSHEGIFRSFPHLSGRHSEQDGFWKTFRVQEVLTRICGLISVDANV